MKHFWFFCIHKYNLLDLSQVSTFRRCYWCWYILIKYFNCFLDIFYITIINSHLRSFQYPYWEKLTSFHIEYLIPQSVQPIFKQYTPIIHNSLERPCCNPHTSRGCTVFFPPPCWLQICHTYLAQKPNPLVFKDKDIT